MVSLLTSSLELGGSGGKFSFDCFRNLALEVVNSFGRKSSSVLA